MAKCNHTRTKVLFVDDDFWFAEPNGGGVARARKCSSCGQRLSLGPANDADLNVQREISAAAIVQDKEHAARTEGWIAPPLPPAENYGFMALDLTPYEDSPGWHVGWCAAEALYDRSDGWPWDVTSPVAGQFEGWSYNERTGTTRHTVPVECLPPPRWDECGALIDDAPTVPATKLGELARQVTVSLDPPADADPFSDQGPSGDFGGPHGAWPASVAPVDAFDDESFDVSDAPDEVAR